MIKKTTIFLFSRGCLTGHECVFSNSYICPIYIPEVDCKCRAGCRVDYTFIPYGTTVTMDTCGNTCSCFNMYGAVSKIYIYLHLLKSCKIKNILECLANKKFLLNQINVSPFIFVGVLF